MRAPAFLIAFALLAAPALAWGQARSPTVLDSSGRATQAIPVYGVDSDGNPVMPGNQPSSETNAAITPVMTAAAASGLLGPVGARNLYGWQLTTGDQPGFVMVFNAASIPADGAVAPMQCVAVNALTTVAAGSTVADRHSVGVAVVFSSTGCFTLTKQPAAFIRIRAR